jgi:hypothetical protein
MQNNKPSLDELASKYGTDKGPAAHGYTKYYDIYLDSYRDFNFNFLEIGVYDGSSVKMWKEYFSKANIVSIDIDPRCKMYEEPRIEIRIGDQTDVSFLNAINKELGSFDIILDDGGHSNKQQIVSFETLFPLLNPGGIYIIEDLHCSYVNGSQWDDYPIKTTNYLKDLVDKVNLNGKSFVGYTEIEGKPLDYFERNIEYIHFYKSTCIIAKKDKPL